MLNFALRQSLLKFSNLSPSKVRVMLEIQRICAANDIRLVVLYIPPPHDVEPEREPIVEPVVKSNDAPVCISLDEPNDNGGLHASCAMCRRRVQRCWATVLPQDKW